MLPISRTNSSPPSRDTVSPARTHYFEALRDLDQQAVAGGMTVVVVDRLEAVKVKIETANICWLRWVCAMASCRRSASSMRLGNCVRASKWARCSSRC